MYSVIIQIGVKACTNRFFECLAKIPLAVSHKVFGIVERYQLGTMYMNIVQYAFDFCSFFLSEKLLFVPLIFETLAHIFQRQLIFENFDPGSVRA